MFARRLVQLIEAHAEDLSQGLMHRVQASPHCTELLHKVAAEELKQRSREIYRNLSDWLLSKTESGIEERYLGLGMRRSQQGVPLSQLLWAIILTKEYLWEYLEEEVMLEEPLELLGGIELVHNLERFFDRAIYFAAAGYESAVKTQIARTQAAPAA